MSSSLCAVCDQLKKHYQGDFATRLVKTIIPRDLSQEIIKVRLGHLGLMIMSVLPVPKLVHEMLLEQFGEHRCCYANRSMENK